MRFQKLFVLVLGASLLQGVVPVEIAFALPATDIKQSTRSPAGNIREADLEKMLVDLQTQSKNLNTAGVVKYYAPFISSEVTVKSGTSSETFELDGLKEHTAFLETAYRGVKSVEILSENTDVDILASDEMALIRRERLVNVTAADGKRYLMTSESVARVAPVDGRLKVISIDEEIEISPRPN